MRKFYSLFVALLLVLSFTTTAFAGPDYWAHPQYNLTKVKTINLLEMEERNESEDEAFYAAANAEDILKAAIYKAASKPKLNITEFFRELEEPQEKVKALEGARLTPEEVNLKLIINNIGYVKVTEPGHYETVERTITRTITKSDGTYTTISEPITEQKYVPAQNYYYGKVDIIYNLYDCNTHTLIFTSRDNRLRSNTYDPTTMVERSAKDFIKNLQKTK